jgi:predicted TIM-barrel fold metal-dependent hydrolase
MTGLHVDGGIVDPFVQLKISPDLEDVPIPREAVRDHDSLAAWPSTGMVDYLFRGSDERARRDVVAHDLQAWLDNLDTWGVVQAQVPIPATASDELFDTLAPYADRIFLSIRANPHTGMRGVRRIRELAARHPNVRSVSLSPHMTYPLIAPDAKEYYPIYAACAEAGLAAYVNVGFPGPRVPAWAQDPLRLDEVCWFFPELTVVMRHGGEPWVDTCVKMLLRWPNLYYATTAFAPRYYPRPIIDLLNSRGASKIIWAGYWPILGYDRLFAEVADLPIRPEALPRFLAGNARRAFGIPEPTRSPSLPSTTAASKEN